MKTIFTGFILLFLVLISNAGHAQTMTVYSPGSTTVISGNYYDQSSQINAAGNFYLYGDWIVQSPVMIFNAGQSFLFDGGGDGNNATGRIYFDNLLHTGYPAAPVDFTPANVIAPQGTSVAIGNPQGVSVADNSQLVMGGDLFFDLGDYIAAPIAYGNHFILNNGGLTIQTGGTISNASTNRYVVTNNITGLGVSRENMNISETFLFPVGSSIGSPAQTDYTPATLTNGTTVQTVNVLVRPFDPAFGAGEVPNSNLLHRDSVMRRAWRISSPAPAPGPLTTVALTHNTNTNAAFYNPSLTQIIRYNLASSTWRGIQNPISEQTNPAGQLNLTGANLTALQGAMYNVSSNNSWFTKYAERLIVVPLTWLSFTAEQTANGILLKWSTSNEVNTDRFEIEHSANGINWRKIGTAGAKGSLTVNNYEYLHPGPVEGENYYHIKQIDKDGRYTFSSIRNITIGHQLSIKVWPVPAVNELNIIMPVISDYRIELYNSSGQLVKSATGQYNNKFTLQVSDVSAGAYILVVRNSKSIIATKKVLITK